MTVRLTHLFVSDIADGDDDDIVQPSDWNDEHVLTMATSRILGRVTASTGDVEELTAAQVKALLAISVSDVSGLGSLSSVTASQISDASANGRSLITAADYSAMRTLLSLVPGTNVQAYSSILAATTASFLTSHETKLGHITVTQAVDLDAIETRVNALDASVVLKGTWNASGGTFPGSGSAQAGESWIVSVGGTVNSQVFTANDRIVAITDNASTTTYASNWHKLDYTDAVLSVAGKTGAVTLQVADITDMTANGRSLVSAANYGAMRALLDLEAGTDFYSIGAADAAFQPKDSELTAIAGLTSAANKAILFTGSGTASLFDLIPTATSWSPTITATTPGAGPVATFTVGRAEYERIGNFVMFILDVTCNTAGTGSGGIQATLPIASAAGVSGANGGRESGVTGKLIGGMVEASLGIFITGYDPGTINLVQAGYRVVVQGMYRV